MRYRDYGDAPGRTNFKDSGIFSDMFPTETKGDGKIRANNRRTGAGQGKSSFKRKVSCKQCGYIFDLQVTDHSGGSEDGDGAGGMITKTTYTTPFTEHVGDQAARKGAGCPFCFSKNGSAVRLRDVAFVEPRPKTGL